MSGPIVQVLFKGRMLKSVSFDGDRLRIGRMRENDIVINNLSVSRFHAELIRRDRDGAIFLEDCDSENGCFVNGERIERAEVQVGDEILIGKHQLVLRAPDEVEKADPPTDPGHREADPWDNAQTYVMGPDTASGLLGEEPVRPDARTAILEVREEPEEVSVPGESGGAIDEEGLAESLASSDSADLVAGDEGGDQYAGLVLQTDGRLDRVLRWDQPRMLIGRSKDCDVVLSHPEVSRRHALLVREGATFEVRDLDSINGTMVNGARVNRRELAVGDVIKIEHFELTFVLEPKPIGEEVATREPARPEREDDGVTMLEERLSLDSPDKPVSQDSGPPKLRESPDAGVRPLPPAVRTRDLREAKPEGRQDSSEAPNARERDVSEAPKVRTRDADEAASARERDPLETPDARERDPLETPKERARPVVAPKREHPPARPTSEPGTGRVRFEVRVALEDLPALLRTALEAAGEQGVTIPAELRLLPDRD